MIKSSVGYSLHDRIELIAITGFFLTHITGPGGTKPIQNGNGTSDFFLPDGTSTAMNYIFGLAALINVDDKQKVSIKPEIFTMNTVTDSRTFSYSIGVQYNLGDLWK